MTSRCLRCTRLNCDLTSTVRYGIVKELEKELEDHVRDSVIKIEKETGKVVDYIGFKREGIFGYWKCKYGLSERIGPPYSHPPLKSDDPNWGKDW